MQRVKLYITFQLTNRVRNRSLSSRFETDQVYFVNYYQISLEIKILIYRNHEI